MRQMEHKTIYWCDTAANAKALPMQTTSKNSYSIIVVADRLQVSVRGPQHVVRNPA